MIKTLLGLALLAATSFVAPAHATYIPGGSVTAPGTSGANAQGVQGVTGGVPMPSAPSAAPVVPCTGGTGTEVTSIGTTITNVCGAASVNARSYAKLTVNGLASGVAGAYCIFYNATDTVPLSSTHYDFTLYGGGSFDSSGYLTVPSNLIQCISATGSAVSVTATAIQSPAP